MIIKAYAKVNLYLAILKKRQDEYHDILSLMHNISLYDLIEITDSDTEFFESNDMLSWDENNTIYRAIRIFENETGIKTNLMIRLHKSIPSGAGFGGASADAAALLWYLCRRYKVNEILKMAQKVGSDVPFFVKGGCAIVEGKGERTKHLEPLDAFMEFYVPKVRFSTSYMYELVDKMQVFGQRGNPETLYTALKNGDVELAKRNMYNTFEEVARIAYPSIVKEAHKKLEKHTLVMMTGSGSAFFGMNIEKKELKKGAHLVAHPRDIQD